MFTTRSTRQIKFSGKRFASQVSRTRTTTEKRQATSTIIPESPSKRRSRLPLYVGGALIYGVSVYAGLTLYQLYYPPAPSTDSPVSSLTEPDLLAHRPEVYDEIASTYDSSINLDETLMGLGWLRWSNLRHVAGDVLEVSAGTGRNLKFYDSRKVKSLTLVDQSLPMLDVAREKVDKDERWRDCNVTFKAVPVEGLSPNRDNYDVIVQSFGLCSVSDPVSYLSHLSKFCRANGQIILIEHGRSKYDWINRILDGSVNRHAEKWGCYYNRDIQHIIDSCPDIEVISRRRWHFGTTYVYHLKPKH